MRTSFVLVSGLVFATLIFWIQEPVQASTSAEFFEYKCWGPSKLTTEPPSLFLRIGRLNSQRDLHLDGWIARRIPGESQLPNMVLYMFQNSSASIFLSAARGVAVGLPLMRGARDGMAIALKDSSVNPKVELYCRLQP